jgi:hypothetical protein
MKIEKPPEMILSPLNKNVDPFLLLSGVMRLEPEQVYIGEMGNINVPPAYSDWVARLNKGDKFPRGKYFSRRELIRRYVNRYRTSVSTGVSVQVVP